MLAGKNSSDELICNKSRQMYPELKCVLRMNTVKNEVNYHRSLH